MDFEFMATSCSAFILSKLCPRDPLLWVSHRGPKKSRKGRRVQMERLVYEISYTSATDLISFEKLIS